MDKEHIENIDRILKEVNSTGRINKTDAYKMFKYREDAISTLHTLNGDGCINIIPVEEGDGIYAIMKTDNTFDGIGYYSRFLEKNEIQEKAKQPKAKPRRKMTKGEIWSVIIGILTIVTTIMLSLF